MPIFEYECRKCGRIFEALVSDSTKVAPCPDCGSRRVKKLMSVASSLGRAYVPFSDEDD